MCFGSSGDQLRTVIPFTFAPIMLNVEHQIMIDIDILWFLCLLTNHVSGHWNLL